MDITNLMLSFLSVVMIYNFYKYIILRESRRIHNSMTKIGFVIVFSIAMVAHSLAYFFIYIHPVTREVDVDILATLLILVGGFCGLANGAMSINDKLR